MIYTYRTQAAIDQTGELVTAGSGQVFAITDLAFVTPLTVKDSAGLASTTVLVSGIGQTNAFSIDGHAEVWWKSGQYVSHLFSVTGILAAAEDSAAAARAAAEASAEAVTAAEAAQEAAEAVVGETLSWDSIEDKPEVFPAAPHSHTADVIVTGIISPERLGSQAPSAAKFLRGDGTWATLPTGVLVNPSTLVGVPNGTLIART